MSRFVQIRGATALLLALALLLCVAPAVAQVTGATLQGRIVDEQGKALPGVTITATSPSTGLVRVQVTGSDGGYRFAALPVGVWDVKAELSGFQGSEHKGVQVNVATIRYLDVSLKVKGVAETITVSGEAPVVQTDATIGTVISLTELENLPLNGRQFANLGALAPGTQLAYNADPTKPDQLTVALNGGIGRNVNYVIDGGDNTDDTIGGALQNFSIEGVQEFAIQTQQYKAEYGRSSGGVLSVVSKTGTNDFHGSAFGFLRNDGLNAQTVSEDLAGADKSEYKRYQYGGSFGGPIVKDKAHFFATYERTQRDTNYVVNTGIFDNLDGTVVPLPFRDNLFSAKMTANIDPRHFIQVRYGYQKNTGKYGANPLYTPNALGTLENRFHSFLVGHQWTMSGGKLNDFLFQYSKFNNAITADSTDPALYFPSGVSAGQNFNTPQTTNQEKYQFKDDFSFSHSNHDFKTGFNFIHEPTLGGDFSTGVDSPRFSYAGDSLDAPITRIEQNGGKFVNSTPVNQYSLYFQDGWRVNSHLSLDLGLRYDVWTGYDLDQRSNPIWQTVSTQTTYTEDYLLDFAGGKGGVLENDKNNVAPRIGASYDLNGDRRTFLRGGFGVYYDFPYTNATILFPAGAVQSNYGSVYLNQDSAGIRNPDGSLYRVGQPLPPNQLVGLSVGAPRELASPTLRTPYSRQWSLGVSHQITDWLGLNAEFAMIDYRDIPFRFRFNPIDPNTGARRFAYSDAIRLWYGNGEADYQGFNLGFRARMSNKFTAQGFWTISKIEGNVLAGADEFRISDRSYQPGFPRDQSVNALDPACGACFGPLNTDARHKVTLSATYEMPWTINLSGVLRYRSSTPYTRFAGADLDGDGYASDLSPDVSHVNTEHGESFSQLDLRGSKSFLFAGSTGVEFFAEVFNLFNAENPAGFTSAGTPTTYAGDPLQGEQRLGQFGARFFF